MMDTFIKADKLKGEELSDAIEETVIEEVKESPQAIFSNGHVANYKYFNPPFVKSLKHQYPRSIN